MTEEKFPIIEIDLDEDAEKAVRVLILDWLIDNVSQESLNNFLEVDRDKRENMSLDDFYSLVGFIVIRDILQVKQPATTIGDIIETSSNLTSNISDVLENWASSKLQPPSKYQFDLMMKERDLTPDYVEKNIGLCVANEVFLICMQEAVERELEEREDDSSD